MNSDNTRLASPWLIVIIYFGGSLLFSACSGQKTALLDKPDVFSLSYEKYELENGLEVVLHHDESDPIVAVNLMYGVGSNREETDRTGFAHLFEHLLFQGSEDDDEIDFFQIISDAGGWSNGGTGRDFTTYYEVVPKNALETVLWLKSDRLGQFIHSLTETELEIEKEIVLNEKRQSVDNRPFGHLWETMYNRLYPENHPYNWPVLGKMEDIRNATLDDVHTFHKRFYGLNNATLVIAGDIDSNHVRRLVEKYFGKFEKHKEIVPLEIQRTLLKKSVRLYHEDKLAQSPYFAIAWPAAEKYHADAYALNMLAELLSNGTKGILHKQLGKEPALSTSYFAENNDRLISGEFFIGVRANANQDLNEVEKRVSEALESFEATGFSDNDLKLIKTRMEVEFYNRFDSAQGKSTQLAEYNLYTGNPAFTQQDLENIKAVSRQDVLRVFHSYIKDQPYVMASFVPEGQTALAIRNSEKAVIIEESTVESTSHKKVMDGPAISNRPSKTNRAVRPPAGQALQLNIPENWTATLSNGLKIFGSELDEIPVVRFSMVLQGGHLFDTIDKNGVANLMGRLMMAGTATKSPEQLEAALNQLGAHIEVRPEQHYITIDGSTLSRNFEETIQLLQEMICDPRWDEKELQQIKTVMLNQISIHNGDPVEIAQNQFNKAIYGADNILSYPIAGSEATLSKISMGDLKAFHQQSYSPSISRFHVVGDVGKKEVLQALGNLERNWGAKKVDMPEQKPRIRQNHSSLIFVDIPNITQSILRIGYLGLARTDNDFYPALLMNRSLGGGIPSYLNDAVREDKGYAYTIYSSFEGSDLPGPFQISTSVRGDATVAAVELIKSVIQDYVEGTTEEDLNKTKTFMNRSRAVYLEGHDYLLEKLERYSAFGHTIDQMKKEEETTNALTLDEVRKLAKQYLDTSKMVYVVVGDAAQHFNALRNFGFDEVTLLDKEGKVKIR